MGHLQQLDPHLQEHLQYQGAALSATVLIINNNCSDATNTTLHRY